MDDSPIAFSSLAGTASAEREASIEADEARRQDPVVSDLAIRRQKLGLSLGQLAEHCGTTEARLSVCETGAAQPGLDLLHRWATALGLSIELVEAQGAASSGYRIDWNCRRLAVQGKPVRLTRMEWNILERLAWSPGQLVTHRELFRHLYGEDREDRAQATAIRVRISKLRQKVPFRIEARWGQGYLVEGVEALPQRSPSSCKDDADFEPEPPRQPVAENRFRPNGLKASPAAVRRPEPARREAAVAQALRMAEPVKRMAPPQPINAAAMRVAELGVIERFLAERGATRCPDPRMLAQSAAPGLVWDKVKRKWVRPAADGCGTGLAQ